MQTPKQFTETMVNRLQQTIEKRNLATAESPVLLMVSGGSDSTALAYLGCELSTRNVIGPVAILHVNHGIRGAEADRDQAFVSDIATLLDVHLFVCQIDVPALVEATGENYEAIARHERYEAAYQALESLCRHVGAPVSSGRIFTAHTQNDRVENFYMRSIVGTGPGGFRSMRYLNGKIARPCLDVSRDDLRTYLEARRATDLPIVSDRDALWREDATNAHTDQFRAYVRHEIVPRATKRNACLLDTLTRTMNLIADEDDFMDELAQGLLADTVRWICLEPAVNDNAILGQTPDMPEDGCVIIPEFGKAPLPVRRRGVLTVLQTMLGPESRIETATVDAVIDAWKDGSPIGGYSTNIQGNLAVSANKTGVRIEPMEAYRARRNRL